MIGYEVEIAAGTSVSLEGAAIQAMIEELMIEKIHRSCVLVFKLDKKSGFLKLIYSKGYLKKIVDISFNSLFKLMESGQSYLTVVTMPGHGRPINFVDYKYICKLKRIARKLEINLIDIVIVNEHGMFQFNHEINSEV